MLKKVGLNAIVRNKINKSNLIILINFRNISFYKLLNYNKTIKYLYIVIVILKIKYTFVHIIIILKNNLICVYSILKFLCNFLIKY